MQQCSKKMAASLSTYTASEQQSLMRFLNSEGAIPIEIYHTMAVQYGDSYVFTITKQKNQQGMVPQFIVKTKEILHSTIIRNAHPLLRYKLSNSETLHGQGNDNSQYFLHLLQSHLWSDYSITTSDRIQHVSRFKLSRILNLNVSYIHLASSRTCILVTFMRSDCLKKCSILAEVSISEVMMK